MINNKDTVVILDQSSGYLQIDMLEAYDRKYERRAIIAGTIVERSTPLPAEVKWHKIKKYDRTTGISRLSTWFIATLQMLWIVLTRYRNAHIVAITNPPFSIFIPWLLGCSYDVIIYDMYPDALVKYGYARENSFIYKTWVQLNKKVFAKARRVFTLSNGMKSLVSNYVPNNEKVIVTPLWSEASHFQNVKRDENEILAKTNSIDKFNIVYSGNWGKTHPIEKLFELAAFLDPEVYSVIIIGGGAKERLLYNLQEKNKFPHVHLLPWQPVELLSHSLQAADLNVVTLDEQASELSIPSKTFNILSVGNPILGICSENSSLADLIGSYNCGIINNGRDIHQLVRDINSIQKEPVRLELLRKNSLKASESFTKENALVYL